MGLGDRILGFVSAPFVGARAEPTRFQQNVGTSIDTAEDALRYQNGFGVARSLQLESHERIVNPTGTLSDRANGTYNLIPAAPLSAQVRMKNKQYDLPESVWTKNPDGAPYILRVPGLPGMQVSMMNVNAFSTQPEFLQPVTNLQIQNDMGWIAQFRKAVFGQDTKTEQNFSAMFPSVFSPADTSQPSNSGFDMMNLGE